MKYNDLRYIFERQRQKDIVSSDHFNKYLFSESYKTYFHLWTYDGFYHNNIKPQNVFITDNCERVVVSDFEHSIDISDILAEEAATAAKAAKAAADDVLNFGKLIFFIFFGCPPFIEEKESDHFYKLVIDGKEEEFFRMHKQNMSQKEVHGMNSEIHSFLWSCF
jgi:serine/threonine protein kinase